MRQLGFILVTGASCSCKRAAQSTLIALTRAVNELAANGADIYGLRRNNQFRTFLQQATAVIRPNIDSSETDPTHLKNCQKITISGILLFSPPP